MKAPSPTSYLLLSPLAVLLVVFVIPSLRPAHDRLSVLCARRHGNGGGGYTVAPPAKAEAAAPDQPELSLLVGVLTMPERRERRDIVRLAYALQPAAERARVDVLFVFCRVADPVDAALVAVEAARHGDVVVLDGCAAENMNDGKTYAYLSAVPRLFAAAPYDYVMKTDDDTYLRVAALADELRGKPRDDVYLGYGYPMGGQPMPFMHGMGYVVSWDVAAWVAAAEEIPARNDTQGPEDLMVGKWLNLAGRGKNRYDLKPRMYDLSWDMDNFRPDTVAVHMLKDNRRWAAAFRYFNVTAGITPSSLFHLP